MKTKFVLRTKRGETLNTIGYSGEVDQMKARLIAENAIMRKKMQWEMHAPQAIGDDQLVIQEE